MSKMIDYLKAAGGEASLLTRLGFWRQALSLTVDQLVDLVQLISGGGLLPATGTTQGSRPLSGYNTALLQTGDEVFVQGINELYYFDAASALAADQLNVVNAVGPGQFLRSSTVITQAAWYVDSVNGDDENPGTAAAPLRTLNELGIRFYARSILQNTTVQLRGTFPTERLVLDCHVLPGLTLTVYGDTPTVHYSGTVGTYTAMNPATSTANQMTDAGRNFAGDAQRRVRITSGARADVHWWILLDLGANTARISQPNVTSVTLAVPAPGDPYNIETLTTVIGGHSLFVRGGGSLTIRDCEWNNTTSATNEAYSEGVGRVAFFANRFAPTTSTWNVRGTPFFQVCSFAGSQNSIFAGPSIHIVRAPAFFYRTSMLQAGNQVLLQANPVFQGATGGPLTVDQNTYAYVLSGHLAMYDCTGTAGLATVGTRSGLEFGSPNVLWGFNNVAPYGVKITTSGTMLYGAAAPPTLTGNVPGQDTLVGNSPQTWAAIQAATGYMNPLNGAMIAQRL